MDQNGTSVLKQSASVALVHVAGEGRWLRVTDRHTSHRLSELRRLAMAFDDGYYIASKDAEKAGFPHLVYRFGKRTAADFPTLRNFLLDYTDDEILAARVALEMVGPPRSNVWS